MEIELKYLVEEKIVKERIMDDKHLLEIMTPDSFEELKMEAFYYDTPEEDLLKAGMAFRVRRENEKIMVTLKWGDTSKEELHIRGELNVAVDENFITKPDVNIFKGSEIYEQISSAVGEKDLIQVIKMEFVRKQIQVDTGKSISVVSMDDGAIITDKGNAPISELEIELYSGDQEDMVSLGRELQQKYNLISGDKSKYQRGIELIKSQK